MNKKILIIEDEESLIQVLDEKLSRAGFTISTAENGKKGLESAFKIRPDLILLDIVMPVMDGITFLRELRKDKWGKNAKVLMLTNLFDPKKVTESRNRGVCEYLIKSDWTLNEILEKIRKVLSLPVPSAL